MVNKDLAKKETCESQNIDLTTLTRWPTDTGAKFTLTATGSNDMTDLQITYCLSLVGTLQARSNASDWERLCKCFGAKFPGQKRVALGKGLLLALVRLKWNSPNFIGKRVWCSCKWNRRGNIRNRLRDSRVR